MIEVSLRLIETKFYAQGYCWGKCWGGGECGYEAESYEADSLEALKAKINEGVTDGSIDSGMGYEKVTGAKMSIRSITTIEIEGAQEDSLNGVYHKTSYFESEVFGKLSEEAEAALDFNYHF